MNPTELKNKLPRRSLLAGAALLVATQPAWAILGVWRRAARRTVFVAGAATAAAATTAAVAESSTAANQAAAAQSAQAAAAQSAAAAQQAEAAAAQAKATQTKTPQQKLAELQSLYDQKLITASEYAAAKTKILNQMTQ
jgi:type IV secretory pathway TrbL component